MVVVAGPAGPYWTRKVVLDQIALVHRSGRRSGVCTLRFDLLAYLHQPWGGVVGCWPGDGQIVHIRIALEVARLKPDMPSWPPSVLQPWAFLMRHQPGGSQVGQLSLEVLEGPRSIE